MAGRKKIAAVFWTIERAAAEFGIDRRTLSNRLIGEQPIGEGYSTAQICAAIYGDMERAKIRKAEADAALAEIELQKQRGELVGMAEVQTAWRKICELIRLRISESSLSTEEQTSVLAELRELRLRDYSTKSDQQPGSDGA